jgi:hypothetical protein
VTDQQCVRKERHYGCACSDPPGMYGRITVLIWQLQQRGTAQDRVYADLIRTAVYGTADEAAS